MTSALQTIAEKVIPGKNAAARKRNKGFRNDNLMGYLFISPWLIGFFALTFIPIAASLVLGFTDYDILSGAPKWVGLQNFETMFLRDPRYWSAVQATLTFAFASVPLKLAFALAVAMVLTNARRLIGVYRAVYYAPSIVGGSIAVAVMWREIFGKQGLLNAVLAFVGGMVVWMPFAAALGIGLRLAADRIPALAADRVYLGAPALGAVLAAAAAFVAASGFVFILRRGHG